VSATFCPTQDLFFLQLKSLTDFDNRKLDIFNRLEGGQSLQKFFYSRVCPVHGNDQHAFFSSRVDVGR
jgi:hypothetical protein